MKTRGRFIEDIESTAGRTFGEFACQFDALSFTSGKGRGGLTEFDVVEPHIVERLQFVANRRDVFEELEQLLDIHLEDVGDRLAFVEDLERFPAITVSTAIGASDPDVGEKVHFEFRRAVSLAGFAASSLDIETETAGLVTALFGFGQFGEEFANLVEDFDVGAGVGAGRSTDGRLVDRDELVEVFDSFDTLVSTRFVGSSMQSCPQGFGEDVVHQRAFSRSGNSGHADETSERKSDIDVLEVMVASSDDGQCFPVAAAPFVLERDPPLATEELPGDALFVLGDFLRRPGCHDVTAAYAGPRTEVDHMVGRPDRRFVMFDDNDGIAQVAQMGQRLQQSLVVARVQSDRRFVEDVKDSDEAASDLAGQSNPLGLAAGERGGSPVEREVIETDVEQELEARTDFLEDFDSDCLLDRIESEFGEEGEGIGDGESSDFRERAMRLLGKA